MADQTIELTDYTMRPFEMSAVAQLTIALLKMEDQGQATNLFDDQQWALVRDVLKRELLSACTWIKSEYQRIDKQKQESRD